MSLSSQFLDFFFALCTLVGTPVLRGSFRGTMTDRSGRIPAKGEEGKKGDGCTRRRFQRHRICRKAKGRRRSLWLIERRIRCDVLELALMRRLVNVDDKSVTARIQLIVAFLQRLYLKR